MTKPLTDIGDSQQVFEQYLEQQRLMMQECRQCGYVRYPPRWMCPQCLSEEARWVEMSGAASVLSFIWYFESPEPHIPNFPLKPPYNVAAVELTEGPILVSNVVDVDFETLRPGDEVAAEFDTSLDRPILRFRHVSNAQ